MKALISFLERPQKAVGITTGVCAVIVALCHLPWTGLFLALFGNAFHLIWVLAVAHTILIYGLALAPAMIQWSVSDWRRRALMAGIPAFAVAILPAIIGHTLFADYKTKITAADFAKPPAVNPQSIGVLGDDHTPTCKEDCENALYDNQIQSVIIRSNSKPYTATRFWLEERDRCPEALHARKDERSVVTSGRCLIGTPAKIEDADVLVKPADIAETERSRIATDLWRKLSKDEQDRLIRSRFTRTGTFLVWLVEFNRQTAIYERIGDEQTIVAMQTMIRAQIANVPFFIGTQYNEGSWFLVWLAFGANHTINDNDIRAVLANRYGRKPMRSQAPVTAEIAEYRRIMARTYAEDDGLTQQELAVVHSVLRKRFVDNLKLTSEDVELVRLAIRQPAYGRNGIGHMAKHHAQALVSLAPDIVARLEAKPREPDAFRLDVADMFLALPPETMRLYGLRMLAVVKDSKRSVYLRKMIAHMDLFVDDPTPVLLELYNDERTKYAATMGLCRVASPANQAGIAIFEQALTDAETQRRDYLMLIGGLVRSGARDRVELIAAQASQEQRKDMQIYLRNVGADYNPDRCYYD